MLEEWFGSWPSAWLKLRARPPVERRLLLEAVISLGVARLTVLVTPFRRLTPILGRHMEESSEEDLVDQAPLWRVAWALRTASARLPWRCSCLEQAIAGKLMLRRRDVATTLYLGAARTDGGIEAHAWLRSGSFVVTGAEGRERFAVVSTFAEKE
jgi:Transglutaminase-like superfamily